MDHRRDRQPAERGPGVPGDRGLGAAVRDRQGRPAGTHPGDGDQCGGAAARRTVRPLARRRAVTPREGPRERVRRAPPPAEDAACPGDSRHHRPGRAGRPVRGVAPEARPDGQDLVAGTGRRGGALGTGAGAVPAPRGDPVRPRSGCPAPGDPAGTLDRRFPHRRRLDRLLLGRTDGDGAPRRLRRARRHSGVSRRCRRGSHRGGGAAG